MAELSYHEHPAAPALRRLVASYWCFRASPNCQATGHAVIPDGCVSLVFVRTPVRRDPVVLGPRAAVLHVPVFPGMCTFGLRLRPEAGGALLGVPPGTLRDAVAPLETAAPALSAALAPALAREEDEPVAALDVALAGFAGGCPEPDRGIADAVHAVIEAGGRIGLAEAARHAGVGTRQFQRRFERAVGLTFKEYARIRRFREAARHLLEEVLSGAQLAATYGYADQSHLIRESARFAGVSTRALQAYLDGIRHGALHH